ncbi:MAG: tetraacyldisaccharide 4'-kinase [Akkermansiaceae bacterium]|nr:tetraacyldisaccharide 4'-kinase [Armatimonadota bacterium]
MSNSRHDETWLVNGVLHDGDKTPGAVLLRAALTPLAWLHRMGLEVYLAPFHLGLRKRYRLPVPVVSVGNLSSGGTGKTPATALIAGHLRDAGKRVVILSRGHGGTAEREREPVVVSDGSGSHLPPDRAGDEPALLAGLLPEVPIIVCRDRRKSGRLAVERFAPDVILLDDGLQYWQLHRDLDIVLLDARRPFDNGCVLPRGLLREPPSHLSRAGLVILTRADRVPDDHTLRQNIAEVQKRTAPNVPVLTAIHAPVGWIRFDAPGTVLPLDAIPRQSGVLFSGIADGNAFAETVSALGVDVRSVRSYGDHHHYTAENLSELQEASRNGMPLLTTEKDAVKIAAFGVDALPTLYALRIVLQVSDETLLKERLRQLF